MLQWSSISKSFFIEQLCWTETSTVLTFSFVWHTCTVKPVYKDHPFHRLNCKSGFKHVFFKYKFRWCTVELVEMLLIWTFCFSHVKIVLSTSALIFIMEECTDCHIHVTEWITCGLFHSVLTSILTILVNKNV